VATTYAELYLNYEIFLIDAVQQLRFTDVAEGLVEQSEADGIQDGALACTILANYQCGAGSVQLNFSSRVACA
jgi:hypothetical protein